MVVTMSLHAVPADDENVPFVLAITRDVSARTQLVRQMPGDSVLLLFPDQATAARAFGDGLLRTDLDRGDDPGPAITCGGLEVDPQRQQVTWHGAALRLTRLEREVLGCLAAAPSRVWSYKRLYGAVWREPYLGDASTLHAVVKRLRGKLREAGVTATLVSVRGVGFRLLVEPVPATGAPAGAAG
jgi:two-component system, OmpR family, response regulator MtrA